MSPWEHAASARRGVRDYKGDHLRQSSLAALLLLIACSKDPAADPVAWDEVTGKPGAYPTTWAQISDPPATYATTWDQVSGKPLSFPADWADVTGKPGSYPTTWADIADPPLSFPSSWSEVTGKPITFPTSWNDISYRPSSFPTSWADVSGKPGYFQSTWALVALKPTTFPVDPAAVQSRVTGTCAVGSAVTQVNQDGTVTCGSRPATVPLSPQEWTLFQCAKVSTIYGLGGWSVPSLLFQHTDAACGTNGTAQASITIPWELRSGPRPFRVRAIVSQSLATGPLTFALSWNVAGAVSGPDAMACYGSSTQTIPALASVQAMTTLEFDFRTSAALCGAPGDPLVLSLQRTDAGTNDAVVRNVHVVFE